MVDEKEESREGRRCDRECETSKERLGNFQRLISGFGFTFIFIFDFFVLCIGN